jgi:Na+-transporting NADH:ubiquinone oxidoreductase subunit A
MASERSSSKKLPHHSSKHFITAKRGYHLKIAGAPGTALQNADPPEHLALLPEHLPFVKPRLQVAEGDRVRLGSPLIEDKRNTDIRFLSPGGGEVVEIDFGPRRVIQQIVIRLDATEKAVEFERFGSGDIAKMSRRQVVDALIAGGLWPLIRELPFRDYARPDATPPALYVVLDSLEPFKPAPLAYLTGNDADYRFGLAVLDKLVDGPVYVCGNGEDSGLLSAFEGLINLTYRGVYPAHDPGVLLYRMKSSPDDNRAWFIDGQDVLMIARLLQKGTYPTERVVSLAGPGVNGPGHVLTRLGAPLSVIAADDGKKYENQRFVQGGILTGYGTPPHSHLGLLETALNLLPEGDRKGELLGLFSPGYRKPSFSRAFLSKLNRHDLEMDCNMHGGDRACIACGYCALVCPVDILPQFAYKAVLVGEVEEYLEHGLLDCVECGLCSYVCPSKIDLFESLKSAKAAFYKEQANR